MIAEEEKMDGLMWVQDGKRLCPKRKDEKKDPSLHISSVNLDPDPRDPSRDTRLRPIGSGISEARAGGLGGPWLPIGDAGVTGRVSSEKGLNPPTPGDPPSC